jgi:hypothetical protein
MKEDFAGGRIYGRDVGLFPKADVLFDRTNRSTFSAHEDVLVMPFEWLGPILLGLVALATWAAKKLWEEHETETRVFVEVVLVITATALIAREFLSPN